MARPGQRADKTFRDDNRINSPTESAMLLKGPVKGHEAGAAARGEPGDSTWRGGWRTSAITSVDLQTNSRDGLGKGARNWGAIRVQCLHAGSVRKARVTITTHEARMRWKEEGRGGENKSISDALGWRELVDECESLENGADPGWGTAICLGAMQRPKTPNAARGAVDCVM
jgi:hypothetical protein